MKATIKWLSKNVFLEKRVFLFCFGEKCMSGRVREFQELSTPDEFEIWVDFIEPNYFQGELVIGNEFTIHEASKILSKGEVKEIK